MGAGRVDVAWREASRRAVGDDRPGRARIETQLGLKPEQVDRTLALSAEGATVPFIARYRKEATGGLDEVQIQAILDRAAERTELDARRETILRTIEGQGKLTPELARRIQRAKTRTELEDLYLPYKPKRRTRAAIARERGLEPLADLHLEAGGAARRGAWPRGWARS